MVTLYTANEKVIREAAVIKQKHNNKYNYIGF